MREGRFPPTSGTRAGWLDPRVEQVVVRRFLLLLLLLLLVVVASFHTSHLTGGGRMVQYTVRRNRSRSFRTPTLCRSRARGRKTNVAFHPLPPLGVSSPPPPASVRFVRTERRGRDRDRTPETNTRQSARRFAADGQYVYVQHRVVVALVGPPRTSSPPPPHTVSLSLPSSSSRSRFKVQGSRLVLRSIVSDVH